MTAKTYPYRTPVQHCPPGHRKALISKRPKDRTSMTITDAFDEAQRRWDGKAKYAGGCVRYYRFWVPE